MRQINILAVFFCCTLLLLFSCRKIGYNPTDEPLDVSQIEKYYLTKYAEQIAALPENQSNLGVKIIPQWNKNTKIKNTDGSSFLKVELSQYKFNKKTLAYKDIVFRKDKAGTISEVLVEVRVDTSYLLARASKEKRWAFNLRNLVNNDDFTGRINLYDISNGRFIKGRIYSNGRVQYEVLRANKASGAMRTNDELPDDDDVDEDDIWDGGYNGNLNVVVTNTHPSEYAAPVGSWLFDDPGEPTSPPGYEEYPIGDENPIGAPGGSAPEDNKYKDNGRLSCKSLLFKIMTSNMYEAGIKHLEFVMDIAGTGQYLRFPFREIYIGFPSKTADGRTFTAGQAAAITAYAMNKAGTTMSINYFGTPYETAINIPASAMEKEFKELTQAYIRQEIDAGATVSSYQSGTQTQTNEAVWNSTWDQIWNGLSGAGCND